jgi:predicted transcriptional regulator
MFAQAFNQTLDHFKISARELYNKTGVREATISELRSGKTDARLSTYENLISALPDDALNYLFLEALLTKKVSSRDISHLLTAIASVIRDSDQVDVEVPENFINRPTKS